MRDPINLARDSHTWMKFSGMNPAAKLGLIILQTCLLLSCFPEEKQDRHATQVLFATKLEPSPERALGAPDGKSKSIARLEVLILGFSRIAQNGPGSDLRLHKLGDDGSTVRVSVRHTPEAAFQVFNQKGFAGNLEFDLEELGLDSFTEIQIEGLDERGTIAGFDLDAVELLQ